MRPLRSSPDRTANSWARVRVAAWPAGLVAGLGAEWLAGSGQSLAAAVADLAVGWALIGCGLVCWSRRPQSRVGALYWCEQDVNSLRANAGLIMVYDHTGPLRRLAV